MFYKYNGESKVLDHFDNMRHNFVALDTFVEIVKVTNHTGLWVLLTWYSASAIHLVLFKCYSLDTLSMLLTQYSMCANHLIYLYGLNYSFEILCFRPTWSCQILKVLIVPVKFLQPAGYRSVSNFVSFFARQRFLVASVAVWISKI